MSNLRPCKDCGQQISKKAKACPHCGRSLTRSSWEQLKAILGFCVIGFTGLLIWLVASTGPSSSGPFDASGPAANPRSANPVAKCVERGIAYYKTIGSYPTLSTAPNAGRKAEDVVAERCGRTTTAF